MIFCVEDDNNIRDLLVYTLETTGFHARGLEDSQELWKALAEEEPELILLDIMLPGEDGYSILEKLKKSSGTRDIPITGLETGWISVLAPRIPRTLRFLLWRLVFIIMTFRLWQK